MRRLAFFLTVAALSLPLAAPLAARTQAPQTEGQRLAALFRQSDEDSLRRNPISAIVRGDMRYADRFGDNLSDAAVAAQRAAVARDTEALARIDRSKLGPVDQIAYDTFADDLARTRAALAPGMVELQLVRPINHFAGVHTFYPGFASGEGIAPFKTLADYENNLKRHDGYVAYLDMAIARFRQGLAAGVVDSKLTIDLVIDQLERQLAEAPEQSAFYGPIRSMPEGFGAAEGARLAAAYRSAIADRIYPAYRRLRDFLKADYLPHARDGVGLSAMKDGARIYALEIEQSTTLPLKAEEVHALGLAEVARIRGEMEAIRRQVGFKGDLAQFFDHLRTDKAYQPQSAEQLRDLYRAAGRKVDLRVGEQFSVRPRTPLEIRAVEPFREKEEAAGSYQDGSADGTRPGVFYYNTYDLPSRSTWGTETLYLHEGIPGHHFQISLAQENAQLPAFMRYGGNTAFVEGWALYAETLGPELGLFTDPYQRFGHLNDEMLRAMRLVVDTGIHAKGWGRDQAIDYMLTNSGMGRTDATAEVERYIAIPGQALAYKIGALTIQRLKAKARAQLGPRFDPCAFHAAILDTGALPMTVLERKIDDWIAAQMRG